MKLATAETLFCLALILPAMSACGNGDGKADVTDDTAMDTVEPVDATRDADDANDDAGRDTWQDMAQDPGTDGSDDTNDVADVSDDSTSDTVDAADGTGPTDFVIRVPSQEALECTSEFGGDSYFIAQIDHVCHIANSALTAEVYLQANPVDCGLYGNPTYQADGVWIEVDGNVQKISGGYEYGGRHHNDLITFTYNATRYIIGHSSIGYGWRACTTPDCMVVCDGTSVACAQDGTEGVAQDGCLRDAGDPPPALQVICVEVNTDGTVPAFEDPWTTLNPYGENGEMILPCLGEDSSGV